MTRFNRLFSALLVGLCACSSAGSGAGTGDAGFSYAGSPYVLGLNQFITMISPTSTGGALSQCTITPALPAGLSLAPCCSISGVPTALAPALAYQLSASIGSVPVTTSLTLSVVTPSITYAGSPYTLAQNAAAPTITATIVGGAAANCQLTPTLPEGLSLDASTCNITGTPAVLAPLTAYQVSATVGNGPAAGQVMLAVTAGGKAAVMTPTQINQVAALVVQASLAVGATAAAVDSVNGFSVGDSVLVIQMQSASLPMAHEFATLSAVSSGSSAPTLTFKSALANAYTSGSPNTAQPGAIVTQIVQVAQYDNLNIDSNGVVSAPDWNQITGKGGVLVMNVNDTLSLTGNALITMSGAGFQGGPGGGDATYPSFYQGESWCGIGTISTSQNHGGGGGALNGGAAGYGTDGQGYSANASPYAELGSAFSAANLPSLLLGPGGGATYSASGGSGGGIILITAGSIVSTAQALISADGSAGQCFNSAAYYLGGSGAGGSIYLLAHTYDFAGSLSAQGPYAACVLDRTHSENSTGGAGRIRVDTLSSAPAPALQANPNIGFYGP